MSSSSRWPLTDMAPHKSKVNDKRTLTVTLHSSAAQQQVREQEHREVHTRADRLTRMTSVQRATFGQGGWLFTCALVRNCLRMVHYVSLHSIELSVPCRWEQLFAAI